jgi:magnesium-transporting ATPase (P-type)
MENSTYLQRLEFLILIGLKAGIRPALLINISFALLLSIVIDFSEPSWDFTLKDGIFLTILNTSVFMFIVFIGIVLVGLVLAIWKSRLSSKLGISLGFIIGAMLLIAVNYFLWTLFFIPSFRDFETFVGQFLPVYIFPDIANILVLLYAGRKMNNIQQ